MGELITLHGETDGSSTTGTFSLTGELLYSSVSNIRIPQGVKLKVWFKSVKGDPSVVKLQLTKDVTVSSPTWSDLEIIELVSSGELDLEKRKPVIVHGITGKEAAQLTWDQSSFGAGKTFVEIGVEFSQD